MRYTSPIPGTDICLMEGNESKDVSLSERHFEVGGVGLTITQSPGWKGTTGGIVWDCAILLAHLLVGGKDPYLGSLKDRTVVDLGCGTGMLGIACALIGQARVTLTDVPEQLVIVRYGEYIYIRVFIVTQGART